MANVSMATTVVIDGTEECMLMAQLYISSLELQKAQHLIPNAHPMISANGFILFLQISPLREVLKFILLLSVLKWYPIMHTIIFMAL
jgi:hypothetical protein